ncbi:MAG: hypothetical protein K2H93_03285, partial [Oscillospiraceae bacterium]|nr:hypothetical protein [Oscillospiraceae bacterium]
TTSGVNTDPTETTTTDGNKFSLGDVNGNGVINAIDATLVLQHSANVGAKLEDILTEEQQKYADVNEDGVVDSKDATQILMYSAAEGAGEKYEFVKKDKSEIIDAEPTAPIIL